MYIHTTYKIRKMKSTLFTLLGAGLLFVSACKDAPKGDVAETGDAQTVTLTEGSASVDVNTAASSLEWIGTKMSTYHPGTVAIKSGNLMVKDGQLTGGKFVIDMPTLKTLMGNEADAKLTGHLQSPDFFDVAKYPEASLEITSVKAFDGAATTGGDQAEINEYSVADPNVTISANLTIKGITKGITFPAKVTVNPTDASAVAKFNINRKDWGIVYPGMPDDLIQDLIWFGVSIKAELPAAETALN
jgi:polyisoprenoid-binding protein YceI